MQRKILIVDDNIMNRQMLRHILQNEYEALEADNGFEALKIIEAEADQISAVLLDILMPEMDGYEVLERMRKNSKWSQIPVIVTTGNTDEGAEVKALTLGATDYVEKPYSPEVIKRRLLNIVELREKAAIVNAIKTDALTGLLSRVGFFEAVTSKIAEHEPGYYVLACCDIENFKVINDQYGNAKGDAVLKYVANVMHEGFTPAGGVCGRMTADNFTVLYPRAFLDSPELEQIRSKASILDGSILPITLSIGRYIVDDFTLQPSAMTDRAFLAKASVKGRYDEHIGLYDESMRNRLINQQEIISEMKQALESGQFEVWLQPQYNHATGALIGAEALVRWRHPKRGLIPPGVFIPIFEQNGFVYEVDKFVWEQSCIYLKKWIDTGRSPMPISVNISRYDIYREELVDLIYQLTQKYQVPVDLLRLEITESAFAKSSDQIIDVVKRLKALGFTMEIDDFGSGYSSLNTLKDVPADVVKLDMKFLEGESNSTKSGNILESIVRMTKWIGMSVLAEGVETVEQADYLKSIGCNYIQGYLYARPMPVTDYEQLAGSGKKEERKLELVTVDMLNNDEFWNPKSIETLIFNSYVGGASVFEYKDNRVEVLRVNDKYARIIGGNKMSVEDALRVRFADYESPEEVSKSLAAIKRAIETGNEVTDEVRLENIRGDGKTVALRVTMRVIAHTGDRYLFYSMLDDMTAQREAEELLHKSDELSFKEMIPIALQAMMETSTDMSYVKDKNLNYICCSKATSDYLGMKNPAEICGKSDYDIMSPEIAEQYRAEDLEVLAGGESVLNKVDKLDSKDGMNHYSLTSKFPLKDSAGNIVGLYGTGRDITEDREAFSRLQFLTDSIPGGIAMLEVTENSVKSLYLSDGVFDLMGYPKDDYINQASFDVLAVHAKDDQKLMLRQLHEMLESKEDLDCVYKMKRPDGRFRWVRAQGKIAEQRGMSAIVNVVLYDITKQKEADQRLLASHRAMEIANTYGKVSFWLYDLDKKAVSYKAFGIPSVLGMPDEIENLPGYLIGTGDIAPECEQSFIQMHEEMYADAKRSECTIRIKNRKTGKYEWQHIIHIRLEDSVNGNRNAIGFSVNVDLEQENKRQYEHELQLRKELIKNSVAYYQINLAKGIVEEFKSKYTEDTGMTSRVKVNNEIRERILNNIMPQDREAVANTLFTPALRKAFKHGETAKSLIYRRKVGTLGYRWVETTASIMERASSGEVVAFLHCTDIDTSQKDHIAVETIVDEEIEFVSILTLKTGRARVVQLNKNVGDLQLYGDYDFDSMHTRMIKNNVLEEDQAICSEFYNVKNLERQLRTEPVVKMVYRSHGEGNRVLRKKTRAFFLDEQHEEIVLIRRDITDLYEEEQRKQAVLQEAIDTANKANRAKSDFLSHMSHDMRTPLNAVLAFSDQEITDGADQEALLGYLNRIHVSGQYLLGIINDVLDMSKIEQKKVTLNPESYSFEEFETTMHDVIGELCRKKNISFIIDTQSTQLVNIKVDKIRFNQIFINLLSNSVKFTQQGGEVSLRIETISATDNHCVKKRFIVKDNGIGMSPEFLPHAFESFRQEYRPDIKERSQGTGLGLAIVKEFVTMMGGTIDVQSELNHGTIFTIDMPLEIAADAGADTEKKASGGLLFAGTRILLAEDNEINTQIAVLLLSKKGCIIDSCEDGEKALNRYLDSPENYYDLILMDIRMPLMDGIQVTQRIRDCDRQDAATIPIVAMSANAFSEDEIAAQQAGMNGYVSKPIEPKKLYDTIQQLINREEAK